MDGVHTQAFQVFDGPGFCQCQEFARIPGILTCDREVAMVKFIDHQVGRRLGNGALVVAPLIGVGIA